MLGACIAALAAAFIVKVLIDWARSGPRPSPDSALAIPPGERGVPLFGSTIAFGTRLREFVLSGHRKHGDVWWATVQGEPHVFIAGAEHLKTIYEGEPRIVESKWPPSLLKLFGTESIGMSRGQRHTQQKMLFKRAFDPQTIRETYPPEVLPILHRLFAAWEEGSVPGEADAAVRQPGGAATTPGVVRAKEAMTVFTYSVIQRVICGMQLSDAEEREMRHAMEAFGKGVFSLPLDLPFTDYGKALRASRFLVSRIRSAVRTVRSAGDDARSAARRAGVLAQIVADESADAAALKLTDAEMIDNLLGMLWAGHDTTSASLVVILRDTALRPGVREKLRAEQAEVEREYGAGDASLQGDALEHMPYLDAVVKESMRYTPTSAIGVKSVTRTFEVGGYQVPQGCKVVVSQDATLMLGRGYEDPREYRPERWLEDGADSKIPDPSHRWTGFGGGRRLCIGYTLAKMEMRMFLAALARGYDWELADPAEEWECGILFWRPKTGLPLRITRRAGDPQRG